MPPTVDNTQAALAAVTRDLSGPVVVSFYARDNQDFARLAASLATYASSNAMSNSQQRLMITANEAPAAANANGNANYQNGQQQASNTTNTSSNGSLDLSAGAARAGASDQSPNAASTVSVTSGGVVVFNAPPALNLSGSNFRYDNGFVGNPTQSNSRGQLYQDQNLAGQNGATRNFNGNTVNMDAGNRTNAAVLQNVQAAVAHGGPYRLALRTDQLAELAKSYRMAIVARGDVVYQFHAVGDQAPVTASATARAELLQKAAFDDAGNSKKFEDVAQATAPAASPIATNGTLSGSNTYNGGNMKTGHAALTPNATPLLDCVITMEASPGMPTATPPAPANQQP